MPSNPLTAIKMPPVIGTSTEIQNFYPAAQIPKLDVIENE